MTFAFWMVIVVALAFAVNVTIKWRGDARLEIGNDSEDEEDELPSEQPADEESRLSLLESENAKLRQENADLAVKLNQREYR